MKICLSFFAFLVYNGENVRRWLMYREELLRRLDAMADPTIGPYMNKIVSDTGYPMRCVRMSELRLLAREAAKGDWRGLLAEGCFETYEEVMVLGLAAAYARASFEEKAEAFRILLPRLDSWALTDSIAPTWKISDGDRRAAWDFSMECLDSDLEYTVRFGVVLLMRNFLREDTVMQTAERLTAIHDERYYVRMALAWCFAEMAVEHSGLVMEVLRSGSLDTFTHNMTIRKMRESYRITPEEKAAAAALKRKETNR